MGWKNTIFYKFPIFRNFLLASTVSQIGSNIFDIALPIYIYEKTHSAIYLSLAAVALNLPYFLMAPLTGFVVDHFDKRRVMIFSDIGQIACIATFLLVDLTGFEATIFLLTLAFMAKTMTNCFDTVATFQLIPVTVTPESLPRANAWFLAAQRFISVAGPFLGGLILSHFTIRMSSLVNIMTFGATLYFTLKMKNLTELIEGVDGKREHPSLCVENVTKDFIFSLKYIWLSPIFKNLVLLMFLWNFSSLTPNTPTLTYYFTETQKITARDYGYYMSLIGLGGVLGFLISSFFYKRFDFAKVFIFSALWQWILATASLAFFPFPMALTAIFAISRFGASVLSMGTFVLRQTLIPRDHMGSINATLRMFFMGSFPLSALIQGFMIEKLGIWSSLIMGVITLYGTYHCAKMVGKAYDFEGLNYRHLEDAAAEPAVAKQASAHPPKAA